MRPNGILGAVIGLALIGGAKNLVQGLATAGDAPGQKRSNKPAPAPKLGM